MDEMRYTEDHEWGRLDGDGMVTVGITDYAQEQLGDVVYIELPEVGTAVQAGVEAAVVESVKAAGEVNAPVTGTVIEINTRLSEEPELVNSDPLGEGWLLKIEPEDSGEFNSLMDEVAYGEYIGTL
ncbi:MAG: glycine cleavage system protein GcvH [Gammaproteobacteria bacterium]